MMQRQRLGAFPLIILAVALGFAAAACGSLPQMPHVDHSLTYSVVPYKGGVTVTVADNRIGKHTVWVLLLNPPKGVSRELYRGESGAVHTTEAFCAHQGQVDCRVSSPSEKLSQAQLEAVAAECAALLGRAASGGAIMAAVRRVVGVVWDSVAVLVPTGTVASGPTTLIRTRDDLVMVNGS